MRSIFSQLLKKAWSKVIPSDVLQSRREFLRTAVASTAAIAFPLPLTLAEKNIQTKISIIGGGIAGLTAGYQLKKNNVPFTIYEANSRIGGRILTAKNAVAKGCFADLGAEFIDSTHEEILTLSKELGVDLYDIRKDELNHQALYFEGKYRTEKDLIEALLPFAERLTKDVESLPEELHYKNAHLLKTLDSLSVLDYLKEIGVDGWLLRFFDVAVNSEYAMECSEQSAINLLYMLAMPIEQSSHYDVFGDYHEVYKFKNGSDTFTNSLYKKIEENVVFKHTLVAITKSNELYKLRFETPTGHSEITSEYIVLTIPFAVLKSVKLNFKFPERKQRAIEEVGYGNGAKLILGFNKRTWRKKNQQGYAFTDVLNSALWDSSQAINTEAGSLTFIGGGNAANEFENNNTQDLAKKWINVAEKVFPGVTEDFNQQSMKFCWSQQPFAKGSYTSYRVGQWSTFSGVEVEPYENIYFAGEHCSIIHQGFMNGAAQTGRLAAENIYKKLKR